ncbi:hypothetical protein Salat_2123600 [Sesamum alatum]|uniref:Myb/SANT-like domain-containing protein n=1 Tax=Sesamum alatum TaxID=300844 RepID=A0AAE2CH06_9LAMI|nr:hypothetical protein Salat_2123600 [Sesamum alatum]
MDPVSPISSTQVPRSDKIVWPSFMEHRFIEFMHEEFISNRLQSSTFSPSVWTRICERMNASMYPSHVFTTDQLKGKLNRLRRAWRLMNDILNRGTGWGWDSESNTITDDAGRLDELLPGTHINYLYVLHYGKENPELKKIIEHELPHFDLCTQMFARNTAHGGIARSSANSPRAFNTGATADDDQMTAGSSGGRRSRTITRTQPQRSHRRSDHRLPIRSPRLRAASVTVATLEIERCVDELTKFLDLPDNIFTTALERFHSHSTRTLPLDDLGLPLSPITLDLHCALTTFLHLASHYGERKRRSFPRYDSSSGTPGTPGSPGSNESDVPEEFYIFRDFICPELFRDNVPRNTSALQGEGWVAEIMSTPHAGRFYDNIRMTKPCFYALVDALSVRGFLPHGQTSRVSSIEEVRPISKLSATQLSPLRVLRINKPEERK